MRGLIFALVALLSAWSVASKKEPSIVGASEHAKQGIFRRKENQDEKLKRKTARKKAVDAAMVERRTMYNEWCADKGRRKSSYLCKDHPVKNKHLKKEELSPEFWQMHESYCGVGSRDDTSPCRRWARKQRREQDSGEAL